MFMDQALSGQKWSEPGGQQSVGERTGAQKPQRGRDILTMGDAHRRGSDQMASPERASYFSGTTALYKGSIPGI